MRRRPVGAAVGVAALTSTVTLAAGCYGATAVRVVLGTNLPCAERVTSLYVGRPGERTSDPRAVTDRCGAPGPENIGDVMLVPSAGRDDRVLVEVISAPRGKAPEVCRTDATDCVVARRLVSYRSHETRRLPVFLSDRCLGVPCGLDETCVDGRCATADIDAPDFCADNGCDGGAPEAGTADVGAPDAGDAGLTIDPSIPCAGGERVIAKDVPFPSGFMRVGPTHLYWLTPQGIVSMPKGGGAATVVPGNFTVAAPTSDGLFLGNATTLERRTLDGAGSAWTLATRVNAVAATAERVYYANGQSVFFAAANGGTPLGTISPQSATSLAAVDAEVSFAVDRVLTRYNTATQVTQMAQAPAPIRDVLANRQAVAALSMGAVTVWASFFFDLPADAGHLLFYMALDDRNVYATSTGNGATPPALILYHPLGLAPGGAAWLSLPPYDGTVGSIAADGNCVYAVRTPRGISIAEIVATPAP